MLLIAVALIGWPFLKNVGRSERFLAEASEILRSGESHPGIVEITIGNGGSFRALLEHSCCSGAGFDAVALQSSTGITYHSRNNYCGEEGFHHEMSARIYQSFADLDTFLLANGYTRIEPP